METQLAILQNKQKQKQTKIKEKILKIIRGDIIPKEQYNSSI